MINAIRGAPHGLQAVWKRLSDSVFCGPIRVNGRPAVAYPLSFPEVSTVLLGTKTAGQAGVNFGQIPGARLSTASLRQVAAVQDGLDAGHRLQLQGACKEAAAARLTEIRFTDSCGLGRRTPALQRQGGRRRAVRNQAAPVR